MKGRVYTKIQYVLEEDDQGKYDDLSPKRVEEAFERLGEYFTPFLVWEVIKAVRIRAPGKSTIEKYIGNVRTVDHQWKRVVVEQQPVIAKGAEYNQKGTILVYEAPSPPLLLQTLTHELGHALEDRLSEESKRALVRSYDDDSRYVLAKILGGASLHNAGEKLLTDYAFFTFQALRAKDRIIAPYVHGRVKWARKGEKVCGEKKRQDQIVCKEVGIVHPSWSEYFAEGLMLYVTDQKALEAKNSRLAKLMGKIVNELRE